MHVKILLITNVMVITRYGDWTYMHCNNLLDSRNLQ